MQFDESFRQWVKAEAHKIKKTEGREAFQQQERRLPYWREHPPKMWARLQKLHANAARDLVLVLETKMLESTWKVSTRVNRSLVGLTAVRIIVEDLSQDMQATGLRKEQLSTLARQVGCPEQNRGAFRFLFLPFWHKVCPLTPWKEDNSCDVRETC